MEGQAHLVNSGLAPELITLGKFSKTYRTSQGEGVEAVRDVSTVVHEGEFLSIVGHSGCGKTTVLRAIAGLLEKSGGSITVMGKEVTGPLRNIGFVFQSPLLMPWRSIRENILLPIELLGQDKEAFMPRVESLLDTLKLKGFESLYPRELSGGMQQRVSIGRALIHDPPILLLDEPFGSLDELTREEMAIELLKVTEKVSKTVVFVTHSVPEAVLLGDRVLVLSPRPAEVMMDLPIELARPRHSGIRSDPRYLEYCETIRRTLGVPTA